MAIYDPAVTGEIAQRAVQDKLSTARRRILPQKLAIIEELKKKKIHIFNVGPWSQVVNTGSTGTFTIPGCPDGQPYVELLVDGVPPISAVMDEMVIKNEDEYSRLEDDGRGFAHAMLGEGRGQNPAYSLIHLGMFVAEGEKPTAQEIETATKLLHTHCQQVVKYAGDVYATDRKLASRVIRPEVHFVAARVLHRDNPEDSPWMLDASPVSRVKCPMCGRTCDADVAMCEGGHIVNQEKYMEAMAKQEAIIAAAKPKGKL